MKKRRTIYEAMIQRGNRVIVGHVVEASTVEASTVTLASSCGMVMMAPFGVQ